MLICERFRKWIGGCKYICANFEREFNVPSGLAAKSEFAAIELPGYRLIQSDVKMNYCGVT